MTTAATATAAWTREEDKAFENAVAAAAPPPPDGPPDDGWFSALAASVPARTAEEVRRHYEALVEDVGAIDAGRVPLPRYAGEESAATPDGGGGASSAPKDGGGGGHRREERKGGSDAGKSCSKAEQERRKGIPWTEEEHRAATWRRPATTVVLQAVLAGAGQVRQGRLAEHLAQLRHLADADAGGEPRAEVLHPPKLHEPRPPPLQHPRHHQRHRRRRRGGRPDHGRPRRRGGHADGPRGHEAPPPAADGHVRARAHGPPPRGAHGGARRRRHARHVPAGARVLRHAGGLPGAAGQDAPMIGDDGSTPSPSLACPTGFSFSCSCICALRKTAWTSSKLAFLYLFVLDLFLCSHPSCFPDLPPID